METYRWMWIVIDEDADTAGDQPDCSILDEDRVASGLRISEISDKIFDDVTRCIRSALEREGHLVAPLGSRKQLIIVKGNEACKHPRFQWYRDRLSTYDSWPKQLGQLPGEMAASGFRYTGRDDTVECYHCGLKLHNWSADDDPWEQHLSHASRCRHLEICRV